MTKCQGCENTATIVMCWPTSKGQQRVPMCKTCAEAWWNKWKHTPCGQGLIIEEVRHEDCNA